MLYIVPIPIGLGASCQRHNPALFSNGRQGVFPAEERRCTHGAEKKKKKEKKKRKRKKGKKKEMRTRGTGGYDCITEHRSEMVVEAPEMTARKFGWLREDSHLQLSSTTHAGTFFGSCCLFCRRTSPALISYMLHLHWRTPSCASSQGNQKQSEATRSKRRMHCCRSCACSTRHSGKVLIRDTTGATAAPAWHSSIGSQAEGRGRLHCCGHHRNVE